MSHQGASSHHQPRRGHFASRPGELLLIDTMDNPVEDACPAERTPLFNGTSRQDGAHDRSCLTPPHQKSSVPWLHHLVTLAFVFLSFLLCLAVAIAFTFQSYIHPLLRTDPALLAHRSLAFEGPSSINVLNYTSDGVWCELSGAAAIDASLALGLSSHKFTDKLVGWAVRKVGSATFSSRTADIYSPTGAYLATVHLPDITLPLATTSPPQLDSLTLKLLAQPTKNNQDLLGFISHSWKTGSVEVRVEFPEVVIIGGREANRFSWRNKLRVTKHEVRAVIRAALPPIPGLPPSRPNEPRPIPDFASLVYLQSYDILPPPPTLRVVGTATLPNPIPSLLQGRVALSLPFVVSLPPAGSGAVLPVARVETAPLALATPNITLAISGHALPLPSTSASIAPISRFASDFLAARGSPILVATDFLRAVGMQDELTIEAQFPAAAERPELLRDVQISNMRISLRGEQIFASAFVRAHIVPPDSLSALHINATRVWPDLLVYDGPAPDAWPYDDPGVGSPNGIQYDERWSEPEPMPLPDPLPSAAFARIRPDSWIPAHTEALDGEEGVWVYAQVTDVPLEVLPGRDAELRRFISKVLFNMGGARAGVAGITAVAAKVEGLTVGSTQSGELELFGLPLRGETWVGKKHLNEPEWSIPAPSNPLPVPPMPTPSLPLPEPHLPHLPDVPHAPHLSEMALPMPWPSTPEPDVEGEPDVEPELESETQPTSKPKLITEDPEGYYWPVYGDSMASGFTEDMESSSSGELWQVGVAY